MTNGRRDFDQSSTNPVSRNLLYIVKMVLRVGILVGHHLAFLHLRITIVGESYFAIKMTISILSFVDNIFQINTQNGYVITKFKQVIKT